MMSVDDAQKHVYVLLVNRARFDPNLGIQIVSVW